jgi:membrane-associated protein
MNGDRADMISTGLLTWLTNDQALTSLILDNWLLGILIVALIVFCETGLVILPFLPGDSMLFATGAIMSLTGIHPMIPVVIISIAAIAGDSLNYGIGRSAIGQQLVRRRWVKPHHMERTRAFFHRYGPSTITIGRFVPIVRSVAPFVAGVSEMDARQFFIYNIVGGILWACSLLLAGHWLGSFPWVRAHIGLLSLGIVVVSILPIGYRLLAEMRASSK